MAICMVTQARATFYRFLLLLLSKSKTVISKPEVFTWLCFQYKCTSVYKHTSFHLVLGEPRKGKFQHVLEANAMSSAKSM